MKRKPTLTTRRAAKIYAEMLDIRRELYRDEEFFKVLDAWDQIREGNQDWKTSTYRTEAAKEFKPKAGIAVFGDKVTLTTSERLIEGAKNGSGLFNFILAHEIGHLSLDHHAQSAKIKNFQLYSGAGGMSVKPSNVEELEADLAAVFFQCGVALEDTRLTPVELARRAFSDVEQVKRAQRYVQLDVFQRELHRELHRPKPTYPRVVL